MNELSKIHSKWTSLKSPTSEWSPRINEISDPLKALIDHHKRSGIGSILSSIFLGFILLSTIYNTEMLISDLWVSILLILIMLIRFVQEWYFYSLVTQLNVLSSTKTWLKALEFYQTKRVKVLALLKIGSPIILLCMMGYFTYRFSLIYTSHLYIASVIILSISLVGAYLSFKKYEMEENELHFQIKQKKELFNEMYKTLTI